MILNMTNLFKFLISKKRLLLLETLLLVIAPIAITKLVPEVMLLRHFIMLFGALYLYLITKLFQQPNLQSFGITARNLSPSMRDILAPTILLYAFFLYLAIFQSDLLSMKEGVLNPSIPKTVNIILYILVSVPLQELIFRGFVVKRLSLISQNSLFITVYASLVFGAAHLIFTNPMFAIVSFLVSIKWTQNYLKYRNIWPLIYSHAIIGSTMLLVTFH